MAYLGSTAGPRFFDNAVVEPVATFLYDAVYRLIEATGREHKSIGDAQVSEVDCQLITELPHANQPDALRNFTESYQYDEVGNILEMFHDADGSPHATWTRDYTYASGTNRLATTSAPGPSTVSYSHDPFGNMTSMPHLSGGITSNPFDQMVHASNGTQDTYFTYDAGGQRVRKVYETNLNLRKERIYLGSYEIYREIVPTATPPLQLQRDTIHVMDGARRVAMVETKTIDSGTAVGTPVDLYRFQLDNHLGSACLELDEGANVISYEEYSAYGSTSYRASPAATEVSARRYRYTGKERDEETGLYYYGARYYAAWLGRWTSADPLGLQAGVNLYLYCRAGPVTYVDPDGLDVKPQPNQATFEQEIAAVGDAPLLGGIHKLGTDPQAEYVENRKRAADSAVAVKKVADTKAAADLNDAAAEAQAKIEADAHLAAKSVGAGEGAHEGASFATAGQVLSNYLNEGVAPTAEDFGAFARAQAQNALAPKMGVGEGAKTPPPEVIEPNKGLGRAGPEGPHGSRPAGGGRVALDTGAAVNFVSEGSPLRAKMKARVGGREMVMSDTARAEFQAIIAKAAGPDEAARSARLLGRVTAVPDDPSARALALTPTRNIEASDIVVFGTADKLNLPILTTDKRAVQAALAQKVRFYATVYPTLRLKGR